VKFVKERKEKKNCRNEGRVLDQEDRIKWEKERFHAKRATRRKEKKKENLRKEEKKQLWSQNERRQEERVQEGFRGRTMKGLMIVRGKK